MLYLMGHDALSRIFLQDIADVLSKYSKQRAG